MNKLLLLSRIGESIFVLKSSTDCNSDFAYHKKKKKKEKKRKKKGKEKGKFLLQTQKIYLNGFNSINCFQSY